MTLVVVNILLKGFKFSDKIHLYFSGIYFNNKNVFELKRIEEYTMF